VTFDQIIEQLDRWAGREVCAAVTTPPDGEPQLVAVLLGSMGPVETAPEGVGDDDGATAFVPIRVSDGPPLGEAVGLKLDHDAFEDASAGPRHLHLKLRDASVEVVRS
jgi:hypothetical protein